jgi:hypothetical protein
MPTGNHMSGDAPTISPVNEDAATPTIVIRVSFTRITRPITDGSLWNRRVQYPWLMVTTGDPPGVASSLPSNTRPANAGTPSSVK